MRKKLFTLLLALVASVGIIFAESGTCGENLTWDLTDGVLTISGTGAMDDYNNSMNVPWYNYRSSITSIIIKNGVTNIGGSAFSGCSGLTSITIPNSVTSIGWYAFYGCSSLTSVSLPDGITIIKNCAFYGCRGLTSITIPTCATSIGYAAFEKCTALTSITIPNGVTSIEYEAFRDCTGLTSVTIPNSVTSIGYDAFCGCTGLTSVTISNSITSIETQTFAACTSLTSIEIPNSVTSIGNWAFSGCSNLTSVTIPNSVTNIGSTAFRYCRGLTSVTIPNSVTSIGDAAFEGCSGLTSITCEAVTPPTCDGSDVFNNVNKSIPLYVPAGSVAAYQAADVWRDFGNIQAIGGVEEPCVVASGKHVYLTWALTCDSVLTISGNGAIVGSSFGSSPWYDHRSVIRSVIINDGVTSIGEFAFEGCSNLLSITIPNSVTKIERNAFLGCSSLASVTIPNSITKIGDYAFMSCSSLTTITIPNSVTSIEHGAFSFCTNLTSIIVENDNAKYDSRENCNAIIETATNTLICGCQNTIIPNSVTNIGFEAFYGCAGLSSITIGDNITSININHAFSGCSGLTSIVVENSNTNYDSRENCNAIIETETNTLIYGCQNTIIPNSVTDIGNDAFYGCSGLTSITIPTSVTSIGDGAFYKCSGLTNITCEAVAPPTCDGEDVFFNVDKSIPVYVPAQSVAAYQAAEGWRDFFNILPISSTEEPEVLSIAEAIEIGMALDSMATSAETYTVEGYVINAGSFSSISKRQNWYMADEENATSSQFEAYRCFAIDGMDTVAVKDGYKVRMTAKLRKYYMNSISDYVVEMSQTPATILSKASINTITVAQALEIGTALDPLSVSNKQYEITGYVSAIVETFTSYGNETFWITDTKGERTNDKTKAFMVYRGKPDTQKEIGMDAKIKIICKIKNYNGTIENDASNIVFEVLEQGVFKVDTLSVAEAIEKTQALELGAQSIDWYAVKGFVTRISTPYDATYGDASFYLSDDLYATQSNFQCYRAKVNNEDGEKLVEGAYVMVTGWLDNNSHGLQMARGATVQFLEAPADLYGLDCTRPINLAWDTIKQPANTSRWYQLRINETTLPEDSDLVLMMKNNANEYATVNMDVFYDCNEDSKTNRIKSLYPNDDDFIYIDRDFMSEIGWAHMKFAISTDQPVSIWAKRIPKVAPDTIFMSDTAYLCQGDAFMSPYGKTYYALELPTVIADTLDTINLDFGFKVLECIYYSVLLPFEQPTLYSQNEMDVLPVVENGSPIDVSAATNWLRQQFSNQIMASYEPMIPIVGIRWEMKNGTVWQDLPTTPISEFDKEVTLRYIAFTDCYTELISDEFVFEFDQSSCSSISGICGDSLTWTLDCDSVLTISGSGNMVDNPSWAQFISRIKTVEMPNRLTSIGENAFAGCTNLQSAHIPESVKAIGPKAFYNCAALTSINMPNNVRLLGDKAFVGCDGLTKPVYNIRIFAFMPRNYKGAYAIPEGIVSIAAYAFNECISETGTTSLSELTIPSSVVRIGKCALGAKLTKLTCLATVPPVCDPMTFAMYIEEFGIVLVNTDLNTNYTLPLYVPAGSIEDYKVADVWKDFFNILPIEGSTIEPAESIYDVVYTDQAGSQIETEFIKLHLPEAPTIEGFTFLKWQVVAGDLEDGITIQAVYSANTEDTPEVVSVPGNKAQKLIRNGNVYILTGDKMYTIGGQVMR